MRARLYSAALLASAAASAQTRADRTNDESNAPIACALDLQDLTCSNFCALAGSFWQADFGPYGGCSHLGAQASLFGDLNQLAENVRAGDDDPSPCATPSHRGVSCQDFCEDNGGTWYDNVSPYGGCAGLLITNDNFFGTTLQYNITR